MNSNYKQHCTEHWTILTVHSTGHRFHSTFSNPRGAPFFSQQPAGRRFEPRQRTLFFTFHFGCYRFEPPRRPAAAACLSEAQCARAAGETPSWEAVGISPASTPDPTGRPRSWLGTSRAERTARGLSLSRKAPAQFAT